MGIPFFVTVLVILILIMLYTYKGGVKTIIFTDTLQTSGMLIGLIACILVIMKSMGTNFGNSFELMQQKHFTQILNWNIRGGNFFFKQFFGGMFITITMTGLDQEMMQKNISVNTLASSQKNMLTLSVILLIVNLIFLYLGGLLYLYASANGIKASGDDIFPSIALSSAFASSIGVIFIIALISALFPSVDGAITSLTSCYCIDILGFKKSILTEDQKQKKRMIVHSCFAFLFLLMVLIFKWIDDKSIIQFIIKFAGITYGPLLGLFAFGILTRKTLKENLIWPVCIAGPLLTLLIDVLSNPIYYEAKLHIKLGLSGISGDLFHGYIIGPELILLNGVLTFLGLLFISKNNHNFTK
jgi:Na+/proline symporter